MREALVDINYLLTRGYTAASALKTVLTKYSLHRRQLLALQGMGCAKHEIVARNQKEKPQAALANTILYLDGFNVLILLESYLSGAFVFKGVDGCYRDISSVHGTYKRVQQTDEALLMVGNACEKLGVKQVVWVFDKPVSNSGKIKTRCHEIAAQHQFNWEVILDDSPDKFLAQLPDIVCSSDAKILNQCTQWFNLGAYLIQSHKIKDARIIDLSWT